MAAAKKVGIIAQAWAALTAYEKRCFISRAHIKAELLSSSDSDTAAAKFKDAAWVLQAMLTEYYWDNLAITTG